MDYRAGGNRRLCIRSWDLAIQRCNDSTYYAIKKKLFKRLVREEKNVNNDKEEQSTLESGL